MHRTLSNLIRRVGGTFHGREVVTDSSVRVKSSVAELMVRSIPPWPIFSPAMHRLMDGLVPGLIQFLPFRFQRPDGTGQVAGHFVGQILCIVDCLDRAKTKVRSNWNPINEWGDFNTYRPLVVSRTLIGDKRLFRIKGNCLSIVIREDLKDEIEHAGFTGQRFDLLECTE